MSDFTVLQGNLQKLLPEIELAFNEPMSRHTSFRIGGPVEVMAFPKNKEELAKILKTSALMDQAPAI